MPHLVILCGAPGSGKSWWAGAHNEEYIWISRDKIRFSILKDGDDYFSHEGEVYRTFVHEIAFQLNGGKNVIADATHLTKKIRTRLLHNLEFLCMMDDVKISFVCFEEPLDTCQARNMQREGRTRVPASVLENMYNAYSRPTKDEYNNVISIHVYKDGKVIYSE